MMLPDLPTILVIDDSASVREVLRVALGAEGYAVLEAADGSEGVRLRRVLLVIQFIRGAAGSIRQYGLPMMPARAS